MPPEASGPVFTVMNPIFIGAAWARRIAGAATKALAPSMPCRTALRLRVMALSLKLVSFACPSSRRLEHLYQIRRAGMPTTMRTEFWFECDICGQPVIPSVLGRASAHLIGWICEQRQKHGSKNTL